MSLFKESFLYAIGYLFSRFQYFFILPFLLKKISVSDYGMIESLGVLQLFILVLVVNNFDTSVSSYYYDEENNQKNLESIGFLSCLLNSILVIGVFFIFSSFFSKFILGSDAYKEELLVAISWSLLNALVHYNSFLLRLQKKIKQYSGLLVLQGSITLFLIYYFTVLKTFGVKGYLYANLMGTFLTWVISQMQVSYSYNKIDFKYCYPKLFKLAIPMFPVSVAAWSLTLIDRVLITKLSAGGLVDVGIYGFAVKMATLGSVFWGPFQLAWMPFALSSLKKEGGVENLERVSSWFFYLSFIVIILITYIVPIIINILFPAQYKSAVVYIGPLMLCSFFNIAYYLPYTSLMQMKKLYPVTLAFVSAGLLNLLLNLLLIPRLGIVGAVIANICGYLTIFGITLYYSREPNYPRYFKKIHLSLLVIVVAVIFSASFFTLESFLVRLGIAFFSCLFLTLAFSYLKIINLKTLPDIIKGSFLR